MVRIAINGFGRIGRLVLRMGFDSGEDFVAVNDLTDTKTLAHLLKYDSVHGTWDKEIHHDDHSIWINGKQLLVYSEKDPANLPWDDLGIDVVVESTGRFLTKELASKHLHAGAKKVMMSAPSKDDSTKHIVLGVNEHDYNPAEDHIISNCSCTTNCLAPILKVLNDNFGIESGFFNTVHSYTGGQRHVDAPHKDLRRARACAINIIPTTSGAAIAAAKAIPELAGKVTGMAMRVPTPDGSITDFTCVLSRETDKTHVNWLFKQVADHHMNGILGYSEGHLVSSDIVGNTHSCIVDAGLTQVQGKNVRIVAWYDNEMGYSHRVVDLIKYMFSNPQGEQEDLHEDIPDEIPEE